MAWVELLKMEKAGPEVLREVEKDVRRLETIADRFSKIGSAPVLVPENILSVLDNAIRYLQSRTSEKVQFNLHFGDLDELYVPLNLTLFEWVVENICKNAIDAMDGSGQIDLVLRDQNQVVYLDITDTGKGIQKSNYQVIFQPGYTTKPRGWGLGLSLVKRIVENYHNGKIFVRTSEINKGTTFRIVLRK
jgi:signal transduction histidine kinase